MKTQDKDHKTAKAVAYLLSRGRYQSALIGGGQCLSGADLRGAAKSYSGRYQTSAMALVARLESFGCGEETRGDHNRRDLDIGWTRETTLDDIDRAGGEMRELLIERYESNGSDHQMDCWVLERILALSCDAGQSAARWEHDETGSRHDMRDGWGYRGRTPTSYISHGDARDVAELEQIQHDDTMRAVWWRSVRGEETRLDVVAVIAGPWSYIQGGRTHSYTPYGDARDGEIFTREHNQERRAMIWKACGVRLLETGAVKMEQRHSDDFGTLYCTDYGLVVKVVNATQEPDGSYKDYFLRVPSDMRTAKQAVAWTFGMTESEYLPACQS